jgi:DNA-binding MarR family transcriptional regulator
MIPEEKYAEIAFTCSGANLRRATRLVNQIFDRELRPSGLYGTQFTLLVALKYGGEVSVTPLAHILGMDRTTLTRNIALLEEKGWVAMSPGDDQRTRLLRITEQGTQVLNAAIPLWEKAQQEVIAQLGVERWRLMMGTLDELVTALR